MRRIFLVFIITIWSQSDLFSQKQVTWNDLTDVTFQNFYSAAYGEYFLKPTFGSHVKSYEGSKIIIKGYFLDFSIQEDEFYLISKNPRSSCFFCGGAGPESVVEVVFKQKPKFKTDQIVEIKGVLELNVEDVDHCNYILKEATGRLVQ
ncbi:hypothetical protein [uncultured Aquimarina sp.]|uniref:hypothetical protein n=1 Tax=uncultured Aquimarina sp. TaxID=575652 RepID=UPI00261B1F3B|nr:hypothetical protein [uncultured Aquimarina sp.]